MRHFQVLKGALLALTAVLSVHCASATTRPLDRPADRPVSGQLADVKLEEGTECIVRLMTGDTVRGRLERIASDRIACACRMPFAATSPTAFGMRTFYSWLGS